MRYVAKTDREREKFSLEVSYFLPKTAARTRIVTQMRKDAPPAPSDAPKEHVLFVRCASDGLQVDAHIDASKFSDRSVNYFCQFTFQAGARAKEMPSATWLFDRVAKLNRGMLRNLVFFEADLLTSEIRPIDVVAPPLTVGTRTLPIRGVEYASDLVAGDIEMFRWTRRGERLRINVSYSSIYELANFPHVLKLERETVNRYVREVFPQ